METVSCLELFNSWWNFVFLVCKKRVLTFDRMDAGSSSNNDVVYIYN